MPTPRRILILNERDPGHPKAGGAEIHVAEIFTRLAARGHAITWHASGFSGGDARTTYDGITIERVGPLARYYASVPARLLRARRQSEFELVVECLNKIPFHSPLYSGVPVLALCHHLFGEVAFEQAAWPIAAGVWLAERGLARTYRDCVFVAISESTREDLVARGLSREQIVVSHPGIRPPVCARELEAPRPRRIAYLGRLERYKRIDVLLRAGGRLVEEFPDLEILVIGKGPERSRLEALAKELGLSERTRFAGFVSDDERDDLLASTRACLFPSPKEGWGLTVIEANALGTPVVAADAPGLRDSVRHEETGLLVAEDDLEGFATALARLLRDTPDVLGMRRAALAWSKRFDWERATDELEEALERSLAEATR